VEEEIFLDWIIILEDDSLGDRRLAFVLSFIVILDCPSWFACVVVGVVNTDRFVMVYYVVEFFSDLLSLL